MKSCIEGKIMAIKTLLGLDSFSLTDEEIMHKITEAKSKHLHEVVFISPSKKVTIFLTTVDSQGYNIGYDP